MQQLNEPSLTHTAHARFALYTDVSVSAKK